MVETQKDIDKMLDGHKQKGMNELKKFFDGGGKLDFSGLPSSKEIAKTIKDEFEKSGRKPFDVFGGVGEVLKW